MTKLTALFLICFAITPTLSDPVAFTINTKKWSHVLDDHFISITVNPTDLLQGKVYGLAMNSTMAILKGLAPAYVRIGSADTAKYTFKKTRYPSDMVKPEDEYTVTETHWMVFNEVAQSSGLDVIVCLNAAHRIEGTKKWDTRNSLELISFSDNQGYNLTWQLGYEVQAGDELSGVQFGKDINRLRTILNAFPRYQHAKLIGPDIRVIHKKEDIDFWNDVWVEAGPTLDAVTWHPRWPQPSKMKVSDNSELGYEFPTDYLEHDKAQLNKILQKSIFKTPVWIGETKTESTGTFAEGLMWARRLILAAKLGVEVVMKQPNLMDVSHPKPEYWIALLHKRLLGKSVLETKSVTNKTNLAVISHCTNPFYWSDKPEKLQDGAVTVYAVNMGGSEQKIQIKGTWSGKSQLLFQYVLTSGSDPDSVFSQMTYLNGEPLMMTDDGMLPDIVPKIRKLEKALTMKLPPYSIGFWVVPEARVKICQVQPHSMPTINIETLTPSTAVKSAPTNLQNIKDINQFLVDKLTNPESESEEAPVMKIEIESSESSEKDVPKENSLPRVARRIRQVRPIHDLNRELKTIIEETEEFLTRPDMARSVSTKGKLPKPAPEMEHRIQTIAEGISDAIKTTNQEREFDKFLEDSGLKKDFGNLLVNDRRNNAPGMKNFQPFYDPKDRMGLTHRLRRSISASEESSSEESIEDVEAPTPMIFGSAKDKFGPKISLVKTDDEENQNRKQDFVIPHQPDLKGLEDRYKFIVHSKIQDGKRKLDGIKRKISQEDEAIPPKAKQPEAVNDIQKEIIKKEIELLEKTEETVADILKNQKKRQETFEDMIFDELNDVKGERITALREMQENQKENIVKRQAQPSLSKPLVKTVEYIEKNFNLEPESFRKIKRSLEEKMGEILRNYDPKKNIETKKRYITQKEDRKIVVKKPPKDEDRSRDELPEPTKSRESEDASTTKDKARTSIRKSSSGSAKPQSSKIARKQEGNSRKYGLEEDDSFEMFNAKKFNDSPKKPNREEKTSKFSKKDYKSVRKEEASKSVRDEHETKKKRVEEERETNYEIERSEEVEERKKSKPVPEKIPIKNDKERRENMLKEITSMVDHMNSMERSGDRSKRMDEDEDISEEFESDRHRKIKRRPRKAEMEERKFQGQFPEQKVEGMTTQAPPTATTPATKPNKPRRHRKRPNRKLKDLKKTENGEEEPTLPIKRHLIGLERPVEFDKKKLIKVKPKKLFPKLIRNGNQVPEQEKQPGIFADIIQTPEQLLKAPEPEAPILVQEPSPKLSPSQNEELLKDLEEIIEEKVFLGQGSETVKDKFGTNGRGSSESKDIEMDFSGETLSPTEGYIVVEPTVDTDTDEELTKEKTEVVKSPIQREDGLVEEEDKEVKTNDESGDEKAEEDDKSDVIQMARVEDDVPVEDVKKEEKDEEHASEELEPLLEDDESSGDKTLEKKEIFLSTASSPEYMDPSNGDGEASNLPVTVEGKVTMDPAATGTVEIDVNQRKRRATFLPNHGEDEEEDEDYSSEERIKKFKQMVYKKSPARKVVKNEIRPSGGMGLGADEFIRMAGSTVRVMFDDVIPEAYGQTKTKIQNMGIPQYIKEFGKIVQQMKNLDQIFLNIGNAAVKGYIKGHRAEKGPYIQVISRKKRNAKDETMTEDLSFTEATDEPTAVEYTEITREDDLTEPKAPTMDSSFAESTANGLPHRKAKEDEGGSMEYARTGTGKAIVATGSRTINPTGDKYREDVRKNSGKNREKAEGKEKTQTRQAVLKAKTGKDGGDKVTFDPEAKTIKILNDQIKKIQPKLENSDGLTIADVKNVNADTTDDLREKISPWIKTTKDFIQQAFTTLQRQRELSEILAKESIDDLLKREERNKVVGKRETDDEDAQLPVHQVMPSNPNKKRETQQKFSDEALIHHLSGLQPGVYVVPTQEMTNIRSEQITNESKQKPGTPNVVTLNIYYDKKNQNGAIKPETTLKTTDPELNQEVVTYYQNKAWNAAASQYDQNNQYVSPVGVPNVNMANSLVAPMPALQTGPVYAPEPRMVDVPNSRLIQYPSPSYHYPPVPKIYPSIIPNPQAMYGPVYYPPPENRFLSQPPGTRRQWRDFKAKSSGVPTGSNYNSGWNIQYETVPGSIRRTVKPLSSYNKNFKLLDATDKKRSVGDFKMDPSWSEAALPFWKFFSTSSSETKSRKETDGESENTEGDSSEEIFAENRKRAKVDEKNKSDLIEATTTEEPKEDKEEEEEDEKSRRRRSVSENMQNELQTETAVRKIKKRSFPYGFNFRDHDILPEWFGTYQEIGNSLDHLPTHVRRSHIVSTPWSDEDEELLSILEADDELSLVDLDNDDDYYSNDNSIGHLKRYPRSTDQFDNNMIKSNMIYKMPMDSEHVKPKTLGMTGVKTLTDEDSSLELVTKSKPPEDKMTKPEAPKTVDGQQQHQEQTTKQPVQPTTQPPQFLKFPAFPQLPQFFQLNQTRPLLNGTTTLPRNPNDDTFYYFIKYAYDSLVKVMKSMTEFF